MADIYEAHAPCGLHRWVGGLPATMREARIREGWRFVPAAAIPRWVPRGARDRAHELTRTGRTWDLVLRGTQVELRALAPYAEWTWRTRAPRRASSVQPPLFDLDTDPTDTPKEGP